MRKMLLSLVLGAIAPLLAVGSASAAEFETFVGCDDLSPNPIPAHVCHLGDFPGAYFEADEDVLYEVCIEFPNAEFLCAEEQLAEAGILYVNGITSDLEGDHHVSWWVDELEIGSWTFRLEPPPLPPVTPVAPAPAPPPPPPAVLPSPSRQCLKAQQRVGQLRGSLRKAKGRKQRARLRVKLKAARAAAKNAC